jgi:hypothetical protein
VAAADDALKAILGAVRKTVDVGDVARPFNPARLDAVSRMLPVAEPPRRLTLGEGLTGNWGFKPKEGDLDVQGLIDDMEKWNEDIQDEYVMELIDEDIAESVNTRRNDMLREYMEQYFPEAEYDFYSPETGLNKAYATVTPEYLATNEVPYARLQDFYDEADSELDIFAQTERDVLDYTPYYMAADSGWDAQGAYAAMNKLEDTLSKLPKDNPLVTALGGVPSVGDYFNEVDNVLTVLDELSFLQKAGVNRDIITQVVNNPGLSGLIYRAAQMPSLGVAGLKKELSRLSPAQAESFANALQATYQKEDAIKILNAVSSIDDPVVMDIFLSILPEMSDGVDEALNTARLLAE